MRIYIITNLINYIKILIMNYRIDNDKIELLSYYIYLTNYAKRYGYDLIKYLNDKNKLKEVLNLKGSKTITFKLKNGNNIIISNNYGHR